MCSPQIIHSSTFPFLISTHPLIYSCIHASIPPPSTHQSIHSSIHASIHPHICSPISPFTHPHFQHIYNKYPFLARCVLPPLLEHSDWGAPFLLPYVTDVFLTSFCSSLPLVFTLISLPVNQVLAKGKPWCFLFASLFILVRKLLFMSQTSSEDRIVLFSI